MILQFGRRILPALILVAIVTFGGIVGCAPRQFGASIAYYADKSGVTDAAARHTSASPYYRFDAALLSDLQDALACDDVQAQRTMAAAILKRASALGLKATANELERMPAGVCEAIARRANEISDPTVLQGRFAGLAGEALKHDLKDIEELAPAELKRKLAGTFKCVEALPDDRGRLGRQVFFAWAAPMTAVGIAKEESHLFEKCSAKVEKTFESVAIWRPENAGESALVARYAPIIGVEWPSDRPYSVDFDRVGGVELSGSTQHIDVSIEPSAPTVYSYTSESKIGGRRFRQLNYVWWFSGRPEMVKDDPAAGHVDGSMLRITLDLNDEPMIVESSLNCGCAHEVFVSNRIEDAARKAFGPPLAGKRFSTEKRLPGKHDVVVVNTFDAERSAGHPLVLISAGYHEVCQVKFDSASSDTFQETVECQPYRLADYDELDALALDGGIASMFGPDGLVHRAGRPEGFLLAPSGILSAGQPRKRGTQRIRWDDFLHDDPHLLENTLRIPLLD